MGLYEIAGQRRSHSDAVHRLASPMGLYEIAGQRRLPSDAVHRLAQSLESGDPRQILMTLNAEHQQVMRAHPNDPLRAQAAMNSLRQAANLEASQYDRSYGLPIVQLRPYRTADNRMIICVARLNGSAWEQWDRQSQSWIRETQASTSPLPAPYGQPQFDRHQVLLAPRQYGPNLNPNANLGFDWSRYDYVPGSALPLYADTAYSGNLRWPDPRYRVDPRVSDPRYSDPRYSDLRYPDPRYSDPRYVGQAGYDNLVYPARTYDPRRLPTDDRFDQLLALERRIYQEEMQLQRMIAQVTAQERLIAQPQMQPQYGAAYRFPQTAYREDLWRHSTHQRRWPYQQDANQWPYQIQYINPAAYQPYAYANPWPYSAYAARPHYPHYGSSYAYANPGLSIGFGGRGFNIGAFLPIG